MKTEQVYLNSEIFIEPVGTQNPLYVYAAEIIEKMNQIKQTLHIRLRGYDTQST